MKQWYEIKAKADEKRAEIWIYEEIGENFWGEGLTAKQFVKDLAALDVDAIDLHINSPGGNVFDGQAIYTALRRHKASITTTIDGLAASIASVVALAGERVLMAANALFMIHDPWGMAMGTSADMRDFAEVLDKVADTIVGVYVAKSGMDEPEVRAAMAAETWMDAEEAEAFGFVDEVTGALKMAATFDLSRFRNAPTRRFPEDAPDGAAETPADAPAAEATAQDRDRVLIPGMFFKDFTKRKA